MNIKAKAALQTLGLLSTVIVTVVTLQLVITYLDKETLKIIGVTALMGGSLYLLYSIMLARLRYEESINRITKNKAVDE